MRVRTILVPVLLLAASTPMAAQQQVPAALQPLKPHQIVEAVSAEQGSTLHLTSIQVRRLEFRCTSPCAASLTSTSPAPA